MQDAAPPALPVIPLPFAVPDPIGFLLGSWTTRRHLLDRSTNTVGTFTGTTTFTPDADGLHWAEQGTVRWPSFEGPASRSYRVMPGVGTAVEVLFEDGRLLCRLDLSAGSARDHHDCPPDTYRVDFAVGSSDRIDYRWDVTGPAKDLLLSTTLTRVGASRGPAGRTRPVPGPTCPSR